MSRDCISAGWVLTETAREFRGAAGGTLTAAVSCEDPSLVVGGIIVVGGPPASIRTLQRLGTVEHGIGSPLSLPSHDRRATKNPASHRGSAGFAIRSPHYIGDQLGGGVHRF